MAIPFTVDYEVTFIVTRGRHCAAFKSYLTNEATFARVPDANDPGSSSRCLTKNPDVAAEIDERRWHTTRA